MNIFWKRYNEEMEGLTSDAILHTYKFTNVYRVLDRVSQYLIREVIYNRENNFNDRDTLFRILLFKVFNNINTWEFLEKNIGPISIFNFNVSKISVLLSKRITTTPIFNAAYLMNGSHQKYNHLASKHEKWLRMMEDEILNEERLERIKQSTSLEEVYNILQECTFIGPFLAYQYAVDFNYSTAIDFDENSFVKAGIGAIRGIRKCFSDSEKYSFEDCIRYTQENFDMLQEKYGFQKFQNLFGRDPKLIDLQNCFCETDKYLRVKMPELDNKNKRIKQKWSGAKEKIEFFFPPKWEVQQSS